MAPLFKSSDPHLAGWKKNMLSPSDPHQLAFYLTYSNILSGILSDILFGILSRIYSHSLWHVFGPRCAPLHPAQKRRRGEEKEGGRVAPLLKSRDPHLTGGGKSRFHENGLVN